jgi:uncharacterized protein
MQTNKSYTLITGASSGLGKELAIECAKRGMNLILVALSGRSIHSLTSTIAVEYDVETVAIETDLSTDGGLDFLVNEVIGKYSIDFLINNAGVGGSSDFVSTPINEIDRIIQVNIRAMALLTRQLLPELTRHSRSYILNVSSMAAFTPIAYKTV